MTAIELSKYLRRLGVDEKRGRDVARAMADELGIEWPSEVGDGARWLLTVGKP